MGAEPTNRKGAGQLHSKGCAKDNGETSAERVGGEMVLPLPGGGHEGVGVHDYKEVNHK